MNYRLGSAGARARVTEESGQVPGYCCRLLSRREVSAPRKNCPTLDVVDPFQIRARWLTLGNSLVRENAKCCGRSNVGSIYWVPAIVPIVTHRRCYGLRHPIESERGAEKVLGRCGVAPRMPFLAHIRRQTYGRVV